MADELRRENRFESSRIALAALLGLESDLQVVAEVGRGDEVLDVVARTNPDVALLDVEMPGADGIAVAAELHAKHPAVRILVVTTFGRPGYLRRAIDAGAGGFMVKDTSGPCVGDAVRRVHLGPRVVDPARARRDGAQPSVRRRRQDLDQYARRSGTGRGADGLAVAGGSRNVCLRGIELLIRTGKRAGRARRRGAGPARVPAVPGERCPVEPGRIPGLWFTATSRLSRNAPCPEC